MRLLEAVSGFAVRHLSGDLISALRAAYLNARTRLYPVMRAVYGTFDTADLRRHLEERVGNDFEILMVHSSVNHMKPMYTGNPLELVRMLMAWCGPARTLVMPAFYFGDPAIGGAHPTFAQRPRFDVRRVPSQMGLATEIFRRMPGVVCSRSPVYRMAALGPLAKALTAGHERAANPCGPGTPFEFMTGHDTRIIGIGKPIQVMTQVHYVEELLGEEFPVPGTRGAGLDMTLVDGDEEIPFVLSGRELQGRLNVWKLRDLMSRDRLQEWTFHNVPLFAARAREVTDALVDAARRGITLYEKPD